MISSEKLTALLAASRGGDPRPWCCPSDDGILRDANGSILSYEGLDLACLSLELAEEVLRLREELATAWGALAPIQYPDPLEARALARRSAVFVGTT